MSLRTRRGKSRGQQIEQFSRTISVTSFKRVVAGVGVKSRYVVNNEQMSQVHASSAQFTTSAIAKQRRNKAFAAATVTTGGDGNGT